MNYKKIILFLIISTKIVGLSARKIRDNIIINIMKNTRDALQENDITYWLEFGTLLGYYRSNSILCDDDDADFSVIFEDNPDVLINILENYFKEHNLKYRIEKHGYLIQIYPITPYNIHLDLYLVVKKKDSIQYSTKSIKLKYQFREFNKDLLYL